MPLGDQRKDFFDSCLLWLKSWLYGLCTELKPVQGGTPNQFPQAYTLCMSYHTVIILLARPYVQHRELADSTSASPDTLGTKVSSVFLEAARNISSLSDQYRKVFGSFRRSPITATYATLSAALAMLNPQCQNQFKSRLNQADATNIKSCLQTLEELSTAWTPPGKYHCAILKLIQDHPAYQQIVATPSDVLADHHVDAVDHTSETNYMKDSIQLVNEIWPGALVDDMIRPSWTPIIDGGPSMGEFSASTDPLPFQSGSNISWEPFDKD